MDSNKAIKYLIDNNFQSCFITGPPGTGKTYIINNIVDYMKDFEYQYSVTSSTGISSTLIKGMTIHRWSGFNIFKKKFSDNVDNTLDFYYKRIKKNYQASERIKNTEILIIDEISLISDIFLETLEFVCRKIRKNELIFGGIKVIGFGDFYQLPPIKDKYCFESDIFHQIFKNKINLTKNFRNKGKIFNEILDKIRQNIKLNDDENKLIISRINKNKIYPCLVSLRDTCNNINKRKLEKNPNKSFEFIANIDGPPHIIDNTLFEKELYLKVDAPVIYLINSPELNIFNGSVGFIKKFINGNPMVKFENDLIEIQQYKMEIENPYDENKPFYIYQHPLILAYAITIHKSQGQTLTQGSILLDKTIFAPGQAYVAISRFTDINKINILKYDKDVFKVDKKVKKFYDEIIDGVLV